MVTCVALTLGPAAAYWSAPSAANGRGAAAATTVAAGATPSVAVTGSSVSVTWPARTLASGAAVSGYEITRYDLATSTQQPMLTACSGTVTSTTCVESGVPDGSWRYTVTPVVGQNWQGAESTPSATVLVDVTPPTSTISLSSVSGAASLSGSTVFYNGASAGSFRLTNTVADAGTGPASSTTATLGGTTTGWTHSPSTVTTPTGGPYVSASFSWTALTVSSPTEVITTRDVRGNAATTTLTFVEDSTAPTGTISYADGYSTGRSVPITFSTGGGATSAQLQRARATLKNDVCGSFGGFVNLGTSNPVSPYADGPLLSGACFRYRLLVSDAVGNTATITSTAVARIGYAGAVRAAPGLLSYLRLGEDADVSTDTFGGTAGVALQDRNGETGATWTRHPTATADAVLTAAGRARKEGTSAIALDLASGQPTNADYRVEATVVSQTVLANDRACVVGRLDPSAATYYSACYEQSTASWTLNAVSAGTLTQLGTSAQSFAAGTSRRVALDLSGSTVRLLVDGTQLLTASSTSITAAGRGGLLLGAVTGTTTLSDTTGLQLDDFRIGPVDVVPSAVDQRGVNTGTYVNGPVLGQSGVLAGDTDTSARFDGVDDHVRVAGPSGLPVGSASRSVELWFKTTASTRQVLFGYGTRANNQQFALWLNSTGTSMTAWGFGPGADKTYTLPRAVNDGAWHQVVQTYDGIALSVYLDGLSVGTQPAVRNTVVDSSGLAIGAILTPGDANSGGFFTGSLDEVSIYSTALSATTVADHFGLANPTDDLVGPSGGSVDGANLVGAGSRWRNSTSLTLALSPGTDPSGVAATGSMLQRATATITANTTGTCGAFGSYAAVATDPVSPYTTAVVNGSCYRYRYIVADAVGNTTTYVSPSIKTDTSPPGAPTVAYSGLSNTYGTGYTVYYRSAASAGAITLAGTATDSGSGIAGYTFPPLGTGWTSTAGATSAVNTYSWSTAGPAAPGAKGLTATNIAALTSAARSVTFTADDSAPSGGAISYANGRTTATTTSVTLTLGTDTGSGVATTKVIQAATAPVLGGGACDAFGAFAQVSTTTSTAATVAYTAALATDTCYQYRYVVSDRVGNASTYTSPNVVRRAAVYSTTVTGTSGAVDYWRLGEASGATTATDSQGTANNGTYQASPTLGVAGVVLNDTNTAATFNGTSQYVSAPRNLSTTFSIEVWLRSTQTNGGSGAQWTNAAALVDADVIGSANDFGIGLSSDGRVVAGVGAAGGADVSIRSGSGLNDGNWHQVVFTRTNAGGAMVLYVDGAQVATGTGGTATLTASTTIALARSASGANFYAGSLDEVSTYTSVLTAAQVLSHYNAAAR